MYPVLWQIGSLTIRTYWVLISFGIMAAFITIFVLMRSFSKEDSNKIYIFAVFIFIPFALGARLGFFAESFIQNDSVCSNSLSIIGSFSLMWGVALASLSAIPISKFLKINLWLVADIFAPAIAVGGFFTRLGCFFNGCCFGRPISDQIPFSASFPEYSFAGKLFPDMLLFPTQIYESFMWLFIYALLLIRINSKKYHGELFIIMALIYSIFRFLIEFQRYHNSVSIISIAQIFCLISIAISIFLNTFLADKK